LGFCPSNGGNIVVKVSDDEYLATPTRVSKGDMTPDMILKINGNLDVLECNAPYGLTSEIKIHVRAMELRAQHGAAATIHCHAPFLQLYSTLGLDSLVQEGEFIGPNKIPITPYAAPGSWDLADTINAAMKISPFCILGNHGPLTVGKTLDEAYMMMEAIEHTAKVSYYAHLYHKK
jgi:L-fuculose-phosphate aldolase